MVDYSSAGGLQELNVTDEVLVTVQKNLFALKDLLDKSPHLFHSTPGDHTGARSAAVSEQEAWKVFTLHALFCLFVRSVFIHRLNKAQSLNSSHCSVEQSRPSRLCYS